MNGRASNSSLRDRLRLVADRFDAITAGLETGRPDAVLLQALAEAQGLCEQVAAQEQIAEVKRLLTNVQQALGAWRNVWPRMGKEREFRLAVAREAGLWSRRFRGT